MPLFDDGSMIMSRIKAIYVKDECDINQNRQASLANYTKRYIMVI